MKTMQGVFSRNDLIGLIRSGRIIPCDNFDLAHINNSSLDITIDPDAVYKVDVVLKPRHEKETVRELLPLMCGGNIASRKHDVKNPFLAGVTYLAKASITANFPPGIYGYSDAKSTSGRLFIKSNLLADYNAAFDTIDMRHKGYTGEVWLVIQSLVFDILIGTIQPAATMERLLQLRVFDGDTRFSNSDLRDLLLHHNILYRRPLGNECPQPYNQGDLNPPSSDGSIQMTLFARGEAPIGYQAIRNPPVARHPICLSDRNLNPKDYYRPIYATQLEGGNEHSWGVWQRAGEYYLLPTNELIHVPNKLCFNLQRLDPRHGDTITHFAGYIDPGFGAPSANGAVPNPITLETLSPHGVFLQHASPIVTGVFEHMRSPTDPYAGNYVMDNSAKLPKQFAPYPY